MYSINVYNVVYDIVCNRCIMNYSLWKSIDIVYSIVCTISYYDIVYDIVLRYSIRYCITISYTISYVKHTISYKKYTILYQTFDIVFGRPHSCHFCIRRRIRYYMLYCMSNIRYRMPNVRYCIRCL